MLNYFIMCRSLTYAQRAARTLERSGIAASVTRPPAEAGGEGCAYAVRLSEKNLPRALVALKNAGLPAGKIYMTDGSGRVSEVPG